ncbi:MAG: molybdopterin-guanine dinucleotide biosynthesis protein MobB [Spirochaetales bacterium]|nr:molybdopterin-guanine dinucleotide biosynthesis protein MobB [Spirochaetales bacterium]
MKPLIVCGYSGTGKTSFIAKAVKGLKEAGFSVSYIKHSGRAPVLSEIGKDTESIFERGADAAVIVSPAFNAVYSRNADNTAGKSDRLRLRTMLNGMTSEYVIIEGFKNYDGPIPKIVFGRNRNDIEGLKGSLTLGYSGIGLEDYMIRGLAFLSPSMSRKEIADYIVSSTIPFVADLDCGECGFPTCREFAGELLAGRKELSDCVPMHDDVKLLVNGKRVPLKGFVRSTLRDIIKAYIKNLHGIEEGKIQIRIR